jgi:multidrug efflux pump subunit AcrB
MSVLAISVLGIIALLTMPVSLLPEIDIPNISVQIKYEKADARSLENTVVKTLRQQLMQVGGLQSIESETSDGFSEIKLNFSHSTNIEYAYIEANEKIDEISAGFPRDMERPMLIKKKPSDIPVFYISIVPTDDFYKKGRTFTQLSEYTENVVKRRFEQLSDVSMVDISGLNSSQITITPNTNKLENLGFTNDDISDAIKKNNFQISNLSFRDGYYVYRLRIKPGINSIEDFREINIQKNGRLFKLGDLAEVNLQTTAGNGMFLHNKSRAISMAVFKQSEARMKDINNSVKDAIDDLKRQNPDIDFISERNQTQLLKYSISNLKQTLILGIILAMAIMFLFIGQSKLPIIISISIPVSLIISFFFLQIANISINIISLSGLILSVGLMIDNSIIVIDNINQFKSAGQNTFNATINGTKEVIRPLISSVLTTCAVFIPLVALSGISGAIFYDQAITITITLIVSLFISIMLIPVLYNLMVGNGPISEKINSGKWMLATYERMLHIVMKRKPTFILIFLLLIPLGYLLFSLIEKEKFPKLSQKDLISKIEWNEAINLKENEKRTMEFLNEIQLQTQHTSTYIGKKQFTLSESENINPNSITLYLNFEKIINTEDVSRKIKTFINEKYPLAKISFSPSENIFQRIFSPQISLLEAKFRHRNNQRLNADFIEKINLSFSHSSELKNSNQNRLQQAYEIYPNHENLLLYNLSLNDVIKKTEVLFGGLIIDGFPNGNKTINIAISKPATGIFQSLNTETIKNSKGVSIPLSSVLEFKKVNKIRSISADKQGEYYGISFNNNENKSTLIEENIRKSIVPLKDVEVDFGGNIYEKKILFKEFLMVMSISLILLYLILAAQFESLLLPLIILTEIIFDISGALLFLYIFQSSLNLMSALGLIVMSGIIINDSIIKIDTIQKERLKGKTLEMSIFEGGKRRFYPIVMTSLTTILALIPLLLFGGMGVELQIPLALSIIGGLFLGTIVSLFFIPIMFYYFARTNKN